MKVAMDNYYRKYYILKSIVDRSRSAILKSEKKNDYVKITLNFEGKEIRDSLYLIGFSKTKNYTFKAKIDKQVEVDLSAFEDADFLAIILEKQSACSLQYLEKENENLIKRLILLLSNQ